MRPALAVAGGALLALPFVRFAIAPGEGAAAAFAATFLLLLYAACVGPSFGARAAPLAWSVGGAGALAVPLCGGPLLPGIACGLFIGLFAYALAAFARLLRGGVSQVLVSLLALLLLSTLFWWDGWFLPASSSRKASASLAFHLNPAAACSVTLGFDWLHAKGLYTGNQTAESMHGVPLLGLFAYAWKTALFALLCRLVRR